MSLFEPVRDLQSGAPVSVPLADRMRPHNLDEYVGQRHLLAPGKPLSSRAPSASSGSPFADPQSRK